MNTIMQGNQYPSQNGYDQRDTETAVAPKDSDTQAYKCRACGDAFDEMDDLITHLSVHTEQPQPKDGDFIDLTEEALVKNEKTGEVGQDCFIDSSGDETVGYENQNENDLLQYGLYQPTPAEAEEQWQTSAGFEKHFVQSNNPDVNPAWEPTQNNPDPQTRTAFENYYQNIESNNYGHNVMTHTQKQFQSTSHPGNDQPGNVNPYAKIGGQHEYHAKVVQQGFSQNPYAVQQGYSQNPYAGHQSFKLSPSAVHQGFSQNPYAVQQSFNQNPYAVQQSFRQSPFPVMQGFSQNDSPFQQDFNQNHYAVQQGYSQNPSPGLQTFNQNPYLSTNGNHPHMSAQKEYHSHNGANLTSYGTENVNLVSNTDKQAFTGGGQGMVSLDSHMTIHGRKEPYSCSVCGKSFKDNKALGLHVGVHTGATPHECPTCGKGFKGKGQLRSHMIVHSDARPFECVVCRKFYKTTGALAGHMRTHALQQTL